MNQTYLFDTRQDFINWTSSLNARICQDNTHVYVGYDPSSWSVKAVLSDARPDWAQFELRLPIDAAHAKEKWNLLQEENLCVYYSLKTDANLILIAVRNGIWKSIKNLHLPQPKDRFHEMDYEKAKVIINDRKTWSDICTEVRMFGVTCRVLPDEP